MGTFAPKQNRTQKDSSSDLARTWSKTPQPIEDTHSTPDSRPTTGGRFGHDFSRIRVHADSPDPWDGRNTPEIDCVSQRVPEPLLSAGQRLQAKPAQSDGIAENGVPPIVHEVVNSSGQPLDPGTRGFMESRFGHDFSRVRVHTDARASESARAVNASAYTVGANIVFGHGRFQPSSAEGLRLVAHELTHVVQQQAGVHLKNGVSEADDPYERRADQVANLVVRGLSTKALIVPAHLVPGQTLPPTAARASGPQQMQRDKAATPLIRRLSSEPRIL
jgi:hypothetical protein